MTPAAAKAAGGREALGKIFYLISFKDLTTKAQAFSPSFTILPTPK
jgi:hypothetical protein